MVGRHRPHRPRRDHQPVAGAVGGIRAAGLDPDAADAVAIEAEILRTRHTDDGLRHAVDQAAQAGGVFVEAVAQALVGDVDQGQQAFAGDQRGDVTPLVRRHLGAGRVVAAAVQQDDVAGDCAFQRAHHVVEHQGLGGAVEEGVVDGLKARGLHQPGMGRPGRLAQPDARPGVGAGDQRRRQAQRAGAAGGLDAGDARIGGVGAQHDGGQAAQEAGITFGRDIFLARLAVDQPRLGGLDAGQDRRAAGLVAIDADAQVELVRPRIGAQLRQQGQHRIQRLFRYAVEEGAISQAGRPVGDRHLKRIETDDGRHERRSGFVSLDIVSYETISDTLPWQ